MADFIQSQFDFILLAYCLASFLLASVSICMSRIQKPGAWTALALFGFAQGLRLTLALTALSLDDAPGLAVVRLVLRMIAFACLIEFGRRSLADLNGPRIRAWIHAPLFGLAALGFFRGTAGALAALHYGPGLVGGLWAAGALLLMARRWRGDRPYAPAVAGCALLLFAFLLVLEVPEAPMFPASALNEASFGAKAGVPLQLAGAGLLFLVSIALACFACAHSLHTHRRARLTPICWMTLLIPVLVCAGALLTTLAGYRGDRLWSRHLCVQAVAVLRPIPNAPFRSAHPAAIPPASLPAPWFRHPDAPRPVSCAHARLLYAFMTLFTGLVAMAVLTVRRWVLEAVCRATESEKQYRAMFENNSVVMLIVDPENGRLLDANDAACAFYGYTRDDLLARSILDLNRRSLDDLQPIRDAILQHGHTTAPSRHWLASGISRDVESYGTLFPFRDRNAILLIVHDVTERTRAETALRQRESDYRLLAEHITDVIFTVSLEMRPTYISPSIRHLLGYTVDEALAVGMEQIFTPASAAAGRRLLQEELEKERQGLRPRDAAYRLAMDMVHKNGSIVPTEINYNVIYGADSRPAAVLGVIRDVSEQHRVESALRESEDRFSLFINYCPAAVYIKDGEGRLLVASRHFETIFRRPLAELIGQPNEAVAPTPEIARRWRLEEETVLQTGQGREIAEEVNGRHYATWKFPIFRPDKPALIGGFSLDVTDQKLAQQQLVQAQKMETVGRLAGGIAHDFNNLLQTILGFSELLLAGMAEGDARCEDLQEIQRAAQRAALLTSQLLAFSRKQMIHTETVPLNALVQDSSRMLQRLIGEDIQLHLIPDKDLWPVRVDRGQFGQILMNLVINARDAMPHGGRITITTANVTLQKEDVHVFPEAQEGRYVCLAITDTGTGMTRDVMAHLFEPFFTTKGIGKGTGMGLPMVYGLAKQHGGWINAYSEVGSGSTFKLYLPAAPADEHAARPAAPAEGSRDTPGRGERILLVEDDAGVRALAILILQTRGYTVFSAADTQSALSIFEREQGRFDLLFSDVVLHDTTGIELAEMLQTRRPDLRVLMTSGYTDDRSRWPLIAERNWGFLQKPFATQALLQAVRRQLDQPPAAAAPPG